jgi:hypothetical protein
MTKTKEATKTEAEPKPQIITIKPPNIQTIELTIEGTAPYVQHKFSAKAKAQIKATQEAGSVDKSKKVRSSKDFEEVYRQALHVGIDGRYGIPAPAFRNAAISACRLIGFKMTMAKMAIFVLADTLDADERSPLVHINPASKATLAKQGISDEQPHLFMSHARNDNGSVDLRARPMWDPGWTAQLRIQFDADVFSPTDVANLIARVGAQVGVGEGRPDSKDSAGVGWGTFKIVG